MFTLTSTELPIVVALCVLVAMLYYKRATLGVRDLLAIVLLAVLTCMFLAGGIHLFHLPYFSVHLF